MRDFGNIRHGDPFAGKLPFNAARFAVTSWILESKSHGTPKVWPGAMERRSPIDLPVLAAARIEELSALVGQLLQAHEETHRVVSRELHDNIAQVLAAATARLALVEKTGDPAAQMSEIGRVRADLTTAFEMVGRFARHLRPVLLDNRSLLAALEKQVNALRDRTDIDLRLQVDCPQSDLLDGEELTNLFRVAQEALRNIERHSQATKAWIRLEIKDNGQSFTAHDVSLSQKDGRLGLLGMRERMQGMGGKLRIDAEPGQGTKVVAEVPGKRAAKSKKKPTK
jgi:signal transduction histidine kinase